MKTQKNGEAVNREPGKPYDLTERTSARPQNDGALSDGLTDAQEEWNREGGNISSPEGDSAGENKVATSLDDE